MSDTDQIHRIDRLERQFDALDGKLDDIKELIGALRVTQASRRECPNPGACVDLLPRVTALEVRVSALHDMVQRTVGAWQGGKAVAGLIWMIVGGVVVTVVHKFFFP